MPLGRPAPRNNGGNTQTRDNKGKLWPNNRKRSDRDPDFTGIGTVDGRDYRISAWNSDRDDTVSLSFREKTEDRRQSYERSRDYQAPSRPDFVRATPEGHRAYDERNPPPGDDIPF